MGFNPHWDYKHCNENIRRKIANLSTTNEVHLKCDVIDCSVVNVSRQPLLFSCKLDEPCNCRIFCQTEKIHYKK